MEKFNKALGAPDVQSQETSEQEINFVITKFQRKGFHGLSNEDIAVTMVQPNYAKVFKKLTGESWRRKYFVKCIEKLNRSNFDLHWLQQKTSDVYKTLFINTMKGRFAKVLEFLRKYEGDKKIVDVVNDKKKSPLHIAAKEGHTTIVELFLRKQFNPNARDRSLQTPLHCACLYGHAAIADLLLKSGSNVNARDSRGRTSMHFSAMSTSS